MCSGTSLSVTTPKARKARRCVAGCRVPIPAGFTYVRHAAIVERDFRCDSWHRECWDAFGEMLKASGDDCADPWDTWENGMPPLYAARYHHAAEARA